MSEHTPGEWLHGDTHVFALDETGDINRFYASVQTGFVNRDTMQRVSEAELMANTRLIAAAPEMLELLIRYRNETPLGNQPHMIAHVADRVIAKATGAA